MTAAGSAPGAPDSTAARAGGPPRTLAEVATLLGAPCTGDGSVPVTHLAAIEDADGGALVFAHDDRYARAFAASAAGAAVVTEGVALPEGERRPHVVVPDAELAMATLLEAFTPPPARPAAGVHPSAVVDPAATVAEDAAIGPLCSVGPGARIEAGAILHAGVHVRAAAIVGPGCELHPGVVLGERCRLGAACILHPNVVIGADGFGYRPAPDGSGLVKMPHAGAVVIGARVEIGAATCVDRGKFGDTVIEDGVKLDNLVQVAHNCRIGAHTVIAAQVGVSGSVRLGRGVQVGGNAGFIDHAVVGDGARIASRAGVMGEVPAGEAWGGAPAVPQREALRQWAAIRTLPRLIRRLRSLPDEGGTGRPEGAR